MDRSGRKLETSIFVVACAISIIFAACSKDSAKADTDADDEKTEQAAEIGNDGEETTEIPDNLPEMDFGGHNFRIYTRGSNTEPEAKNSMIYMESETGDLVEDAVYKRQKKIESRFNINIDSIPYDYNDSGASAAQKSILAGDDAFDLLSVHGSSIYTLAQKNLLLDWIENMPHVNFEAPWWPEDEAKSMRLGGKLYFIIGELTYQNLNGANCMLFNKDLFKNLNIEYPYADVVKGSWTLDKFISIVKRGTADLNGDGAMVPEDDRYGLEIYADTVYTCGVFYCGGDKVITVHEDGSLELTVFNERTVSIYEKFFDMMKSGGAYVFYDASKRTDFSRTAFREGRALFYAGLMAHVVTHRDLDIGMGVVPCPKYDESTPKYYQNSYLGSQVYGIPVTSGDTERTSIIVEALSAEGYRMIKPVYYEEALKRKFTRDDESADMLDYIRDGLVFDFAQYFGNISGNFAFTGYQLFLQKDPNFASFYEKNERAVQKNIDKTNEEYGFFVSK